MNIEFQSITIKNFLSFGNVPQTLPLNDKKYQVIIGYNKDKSNSIDDRNGVGKSSVFEAIYYALFGKSIGNKVTLGNLVNNINKKNMVVTLKFKKGDTEYEITRGRSPNILTLLKNGESVLSDESQGDSRETQKEIENILGFNEDIYNQIVCLSCKVPVFLDQTTANQKVILEKILGIDIISKKIEALKSLIKETKNNLMNEQFKCDTVKNQNETLRSSIQKATEELTKSRNEYQQSLLELLEETKNKYESMSQFDIDNELKQFELLDEWNKIEGVNNQNRQLIATLNKNISDIELNENNLKNELVRYSQIDFVKEKENVEYNESLEHEISLYTVALHHHNEKKQELQQEKMKEIQYQKKIDELNNKLANVNPKICPVCGGEMDIEHLILWKTEINNNISSLTEEKEKVINKIAELTNIVESFEEKSFVKKDSSFKSTTDLLSAENRVKQIAESLEQLSNTKINYQESIKGIEIIDNKEKPTTFYKTREEALEHRVMLNNLKNKIEETSEKMKVDPYENQFKSIEEMKKSIVDYDDSLLKQLQDDLITQETLLKLLNSPSSFIRKAILDKSLTFLNSKIMEYLEKLGSLHIVSFNNDMSIDIKYMGIEFGYVSSGEMGRISTALTLAFRDAWESLNNCSINLLALDEVIDRIGLDTSGVELMTRVLCSKNDKNIMLVSHNESVINHAPNLITMIKEHNFTTIDKD